MTYLRKQSSLRAYGSYVALSAVKKERKVKASTVGVVAGLLVLLSSL